jgi:CheY-like chemotaxis protein
MTALPRPRPDPFAEAEAPRRALLVDDEAVIRFALRRFFERQGWVVDEASDGAAAFECLLAGDADTPRYDVVICDLRMPGLSGIELHERLIRERPIAVQRLIFSTGDAVSGDVAAFLARSGRPVLTKPFELWELRGLVAEVAGR